MTEFSFDLQRFATIEVATQTELENAISDAKAGDVIRLTANIQNAAGFTVDKDITIDFDNNVYTMTSSGEINVASGATVTFNSNLSDSNTTDVTISGTIKNAGTLTLTNVTLNKAITSTGTLNYNVDTMNRLINAVTYSPDGVDATIKFTADITATQVLNIADGKQLTFDFDGHTYTATTYNGTSSSLCNIVPAKGSIVTLQNGTIAYTDLRYGSTSTTYALISNSGKLTLNAMTLGSGSYTLCSSNVGTASLSKDTTITLTSGQSITYRNDENQLPVTYTMTGSSAKFTFNLNDDSTENIIVTGWDTGVAFTAAKDGSNTITYTVTTGGLQASSDNGKVKIWTGGVVNQQTEISIDDLNFDSSTKLDEGFLVTNGALTISAGNTTLDALTVGTPIHIFSSADYSIIYGTITKNADGTYSLAKDDSLTTDLSSVTINNGLTVDFSSDYAGIPITIGSTANFISTGSETFTVSAKNSSVGGAKSISLVSGTLLTSDATQTISAGTYKVSGYSDTNASNNDGITIAASNGNVTVGDIDLGESFTVGDLTYTKAALGLKTTEKNVEKLYTGAQTVSADGAVAVDLTNLSDGMRPYIAASQSALVLGGDTHTYSAVVVDNASNPTTKYAELKVDASSNTYTLTTIDGGEDKLFRAGVSMISVAGGNTTFNKSLVGDEMKIVTKGGATFVVKESSTTFTVNGVDPAPTVTNATKITLLDGTITATSGQSIILGDGGVTFKVTSSSSGIQLTFDETTSTATIKGKSGDTFILPMDGAEKTYSVNATTDGMTFTVDKDGNISVSDLTVNDGDVFTFDGSTYSVKGAGFIRDTAYLWNVSGVHSLTGNSVSVADIQNDDNWGALTLVNTYYSSINFAQSIIPSTTDEVTLVGDSYDNYAHIYGTFSYSGGSYVVTTLDATAKYSYASLSPEISNLSMGSGLTNVTIWSPYASFTVTDDGSDGYQITLASDMASVIGQESLTLLNGTLQSDSNVSARIGNSIVAASESSTITLTSSGTDGVVSLDENESFIIDKKGSYTLKSIGLINDKSQRLLKSTDGNITLSYLNDSDNWGSLMGASALTISANTPNVLIVDDTANPVSIYAEYTAKTKTLSKSGDYEKLGTNLININDTTITITSDFAGSNAVSVHGVQSDAVFLVKDENSDFTVNDRSAGAVIGTATNISQTAGLISVTSSGQTLNSAAGTFQASVGGTTFNVSGSSATVGAIDKSDVFIFDGTAYTKETVGLMNSDSLLTGVSVNSSVDVADLAKQDNWQNTASIARSILNVNSSSLTGSGPWIVIDANKTTRYGTLSKVGNGYSIIKDTKDTTWLKDYTISVAGASLSLTDDFLNVSLAGSRSSVSFFVTDSDGDFIFTDGNSGASISTDAKSIRQTGGLLHLTDTAQTIYAGTNASNNQINLVENGDGKSDGIKINVSSANATISAIDTGDKFKFADYEYELLSNGRLRRDDGSGAKELWSGTTIRASNGTITSGNILNDSNWFDLTTITDGNFTIDSTAIDAITGTPYRAYVIDSTDDTMIYGALKTNSGKTQYSLTADDSTSGLTRSENLL